MRFATFEIAERQSWGIVAENGLIDLQERLPYPTLQAAIDAGALHEAAAFGGEGTDYSFNDTRLLPPIPDPAHIFCVGTNYMDHLSEVREAGIDRKRGDHPAIFTRFADSLVGHDRELLRPRVSDKFDYEAELAVIVGKGGRYIAEADAWTHIAGYTCFNDGSIRDWQFHTGQITPGKNFFRSGSAGPWMVDASTIGDATKLDISLRLNGVTLQSSNTSLLIFDIPAIMAYVSAIAPLQPGDVIATGTPAGVGFSRKPPVFMKPGDVCEVEIERVGVLRNAIADEVR